MERRRENLNALSRALPRGDAMLALSRQRFDASAERLRGALFQNLQRHGAQLARAGTLLRPRLIANDLEKGHAALARAEGRMARAYAQRVNECSRGLNACARVLESVSYRAVLSRGFALVRNGDGVLRRRASQVKSGECLSLVFADGQIAAVAAGNPPNKGTRTTSARKRDQGDLF
jgi:exodeoxyribonuclease VII large subunit